MIDIDILFVFCLTVLYFIFGFTLVFIFPLCSTLYSVNLYALVTLSLKCSLLYSHQSRSVISFWQVSSVLAFMSCSCAASINHINNEYRRELDSFCHIVFTSFCQKAKNKTNCLMLKNNLKTKKQQSIRCLDNHDAEKYGCSQTSKV